jgi:crotonobetainyl-CoA:carnitine CoA-transferase CaiB-like acyl-CoA transferase
VEDEDLGGLLQHNVLYRMSATPGAIRATGRAHGADTDAVLTERLGLSAERLQELRDADVIR